MKRTANSCIYIYCSLTSAIRVDLQGAHDSFVHCQCVRRRWGWSRTGRTRCSTSARSPCSEAFRGVARQTLGFCFQGLGTKKGAAPGTRYPWGGHVSQRRASRPPRPVPSRAPKANQDFWSWETPLLQPYPQFYVGSTRHLL